MTLILLNLITFIARVFITMYDFKNKNYKPAIINSFFTGIFFGFLLYSITNYILKN